MLNGAKKEQFKKCDWGAIDKDGQRRGGSYFSISSSAPGSDPPNCKKWSEFRVEGLGLRV